jgi:hypothetical protein
MNFQDYIINDVAMQDINQDVAAVKAIFDELTYSHLPISENGVYIGCMSENDVRCFEAEKSLKDCRYSFESFFARNTVNWLDVLENFANNHTNIMPVLDDQNNYLGYVELNDIISLFNETPFLNESGGIVVVEKGINDYSFSEVCQIVEANDIKVLGAFISKMEQGVVEVTVKIGHAALNEVLQSFRRYGYSVVSSHQEDTFYKNLKERSRYLDKYLNI